MSNYLAVATVTAILQRVLQAAVQSDVDGARVTTLQPRNIGNSTPETGINLFLYQVTRNPALSNADTAPFRSKGTPIKRQAALDLFYIVSFYGNEAELEPQQLLGSVTRIFNDRPILNNDDIRETIADPSFRFLANSNLPDHVQQINIYPIDLSLDDLSKAWSAFFQSPYFLSLIYKVTVVTIEGDESWRRALPVRDRGIGGVVPFPNQPVVEQVISAEGKLEPILSTTTLHIRGKQLQNPHTTVRINGFELTPTELSDTLLVVSLGDLPVDSLHAGLQGLQVIHRIPTGTASMPGSDRAVESNIAPFVLRPTIQHVSLSQSPVRDEDVRNALVMLQVNVRVGMKQRAVLSLNEWAVEEPMGYQFEATSRTSDTDNLMVSVQGVKPGEYLLRLQIDGAESLLSVDSDPSSPTYQWFAQPRVRIH